MAGKIGEFENRFLAYDFYAFSPKEEKALKAYAQRKSRWNSLDGILSFYDETKASLIVFTIDPSVKREDLQAIVQRIQKRTNVPFVFPVFDQDKNAVVFYV